MAILTIKPNAMVKNTDLKTRRSNAQNSLHSGQHVSNGIKTTDGSCFGPLFKPLFDTIFRGDDRRMILQPIMAGYLTIA